LRIDLSFAIANFVLKEGVLLTIMVLWLILKWK